MNSKYKVLLLVYFLVFMGGCTTLIDKNIKPDTQQYLIQGVEEQISRTQPEVSYVEESSNEEMVEDLSNYVLINPESNVEEVTNLRGLSTGKKTFNSDLMVVAKHFDKTKVKLSIEEMPLNKFLHLVFAKVLKVDYVLDKTVQNSKQPVSINIKEKISKQKLFSIVSNVLEEFNIIIEVDSDIFYLKKSSKGAVASVHKVYLGNSIPSGLDENDVIYMMRPFFYNKQITKYNIFVKEYFLSKKSELRIDDYEQIIQSQYAHTNPKYKYILLTPYSNITKATNIST